MLVTRIDGILDAERLSRVRTIIDAANFVDGRISGGTARDKKNLEMAPETDRYVEVLTIVEAAVRESLEFNLTAYPRYMTRPIFSRYEEGMYYDQHVDLPVMGFMSANKPGSRGLGPVGANYVRSDLSMTVFLGEPSDYDGGELIFEGPFGPICAKPTAGSGILYPTGSRHSVGRVTRGVRLAAVFWIQTMFPVEAHRRAVIDAQRLMSLIKKRAPDSPEHILAQDSFYNLCRMLATV
jgi:PKHD-type hydroxylase